MTRVEQVKENNVAIDNNTSKSIKKAISVNGSILALENAKVEILKDISITLALIADRGL